MKTVKEWHEHYLAEANETAKKYAPSPAASAQAPVENRGANQLVGSGSLVLCPASLVDDAAFHLSYAARMANELRRPDMADKLIAIARDLIFRADAARATERQPEENT